MRLKFLQAKGIGVEDWIEYNWHSKTLASIHIEIIYGKKITRTWILYFKVQRETTPFESQVTLNSQSNRKHFLYRLVSSKVENNRKHKTHNKYHYL